MKKYIPIIVICFLLTTSASAAIYAFTSQQLAPSPVNGYILQTNGSKNAWVDASILSGSWATTSTNYWLTTKTTDNLTEGSSNKYWSNLLWAGQLAGTTTDALDEGSVNLYDKTVAFTNGTNVSMTGTYPNFIISDSLTPSFTDLTVSGTASSSEICFLGDGCRSSWDALGISTTLYYHTDTSDISPYESLLDFSTTSPEVDETCNADADVAGGYCQIDGYITDPDNINITESHGGVYGFRSFAYVDSVAGNTVLEYTLYTRTSGGVETLITQATSTEINSTSVTEYTKYINVSSFTVPAGGRVLVKVNFVTDSSATIAGHFLYEGTEHTSHIETPITVADLDFAEKTQNNTFTGTNNFQGVTFSSASTSALALTGFTGFVYANGTTKPVSQATNSDLLTLLEYTPLDQSLYYGTTTHPNISSLPALSITKSQVSDFPTSLATSTLLGDNNTFSGSRTAITHASTTNFSVSAILDLFGTVSTSFATLITNIKNSLDDLDWVLTGIWDFGGAKLEMPNSSSLVLNSTTGRFGLDTKYDEFKIFGATATSTYVPDMDRCIGQIASTTLGIDGKIFTQGTTTFRATQAMMRSFNVNAVGCIGTSANGGIVAGNGTASSSYQTCGTSFASSTASFTVIPGQSLYFAVSSSANIITPCANTSATPH